MAAMTFEDILKSSPTTDEPTGESFSIFKTDDDKRLVFGWASVAVTVDGEQLEDRQKDIIEPEDLESAAYEYVLNFRDTGEEHISSMRKKGKLVESVVFTEEKQKAMGIPPGTLPVAWWIGFKIDDDAAWARVKNGTYKMFSIEGKANRIPVEKGQLKGCGVLVVQDGKILSGTRIERGGRGKICGPGGHIEDGETPEEAAKREAMEEFGITCEELTPLGTLKDGSSAIFLCTKFSGTPETDEKEMTEPKWRTIEELEKVETFSPFQQSLEFLDLSPAKRHSVAKTFNEILKYNDYHDPATGRFAPKGGSSVAPKMSAATAIGEYQNYAYQAVNNGLRSDNLDGTAKEIVDTLDEAFERAEPTKYAQTLHRADGAATTAEMWEKAGLPSKLPQSGDFMDVWYNTEARNTIINAMVGQTFTDKGFMSTSKSWEKAEEFAAGNKYNPHGVEAMVHINVPKGTKVLDLGSDGFISGSGEEETILNRGSSYKITAVMLNHRTNGLDIYADLLTDTAKSATVAKTFSDVLKFNPFHDALGRFATANGYATFTMQTKDPKKQHWADKAIARMKQQAAANPPAPQAPPKPVKNYDSKGFADYDDADYHQLYNRKQYFQQQQLTPAQKKAADDYVNPNTEPGSLYNVAQNVNWNMLTGKPMTAKQQNVHDNMMSAMHNIGHNITLTRYDHDGMVNSLLSSLGAGTDYTKMSIGKIQKALVGQTIGENKFISTTVNNFSKAPASAQNLFINRAVKINYKAKANVQGLLMPIGSGGDQGELVLAPTNGKANQAPKITAVRFTGNTIYRVKTGRNYPQIEIDLEWD